MSSFSKRALEALSQSSALALAFVGTAFIAAPAVARETTPLAATPETAATPDKPAATDDSDASSPDIVVTALRREQRLQDVPTAVTALSADVFTKGGLGRSANTVLTLVPNASAGTQQHGRPRWWIRGVGAGQQQLDLANPVGFYLDDVYISNASATGLPLFDLERVEVLRGPQGTLWGKNTTGGAINVISKKPSLTAHDDDNYVRLDYGSYDEKLAEAGVGVVVVPDLLAARVSAHFDDRGGRFTNLFTGDKANAVRDTVLRGQLLFAPVSNFQALLSVHYRDYSTDGTYWTTASYLPTGVLRSGYIPPTDKDDVNINAP